MEILITFDKLTVLIGVLESLKLQEALEDPACVFLELEGLKGVTIWRRISQAQNIDLGNAEISGVLDLLTAKGFLTAGARLRIADYVAAQSVITEAPSSQMAHKYRVPLSGAPAGQNPIAWISQFMTTDNSAWVEGDWILVATDGACNAPGVEVV